MWLDKYETLVVPKTDYGIRFADEFCQRLKLQGAFVGRKDDEETIQIKAKYQLSISDKE